MLLRLDDAMGNLASFYSSRSSSSKDFTIDPALTKISQSEIKIVNSNNRLIAPLVAILEESVEPPRRRDDITAAFWKAVAISGQSKELVGNQEPVKSCPSPTVRQEYILSLEAMYQLLTKSDEFDSYEKNSLINFGRDNGHILCCALFRLT